MESDDDVSSDDDDVDEKTPSQAATPQSSINTPQRQEKLVGAAGTTGQSPSDTRADCMAPCSAATTEMSIHTQPLCSSETPFASQPSLVTCTAIEPSTSVALAGDSYPVTVNSCDKTMQECSSEKSVIGSTSGDLDQPGAALSNKFPADYEERVMQEAASLLASLSDTLLSPPRPSVDSCQEGTHLWSSSSAEVSLCVRLFVCSLHFFANLLSRHMLLW